MAGGARIGLARPPPDRALAERRDAAVGGVGDAAHLVRLDVAGDDQDRVLGRVEAPVVGERVLAIEALDLVHPADDRRAVGMVHEQRRRHRLRKLGRRIGLDPHAALLEHDVALGRDHRLVEDEAGHAVGLELHHGPEVLAGDALEIGGVVVGGEGVLLAAERRDDLAELARRVPARALEHQMLEEMGDAGLADRIVGRAVAVPDHVRDDGHAAVGHDHHLESVVEIEGRHLGPASVGSPEGRRLGAERGGAGRVSHSRSLAH